MPQVNQIPWTFMYLSFFTLIMLMALSWNFAKTSSSFNPKSLLLSDFMDF